MIEAKAKELALLNYLSLHKNTLQKETVS